MSRFQVGLHLRPCDGEAVSGDAIVVRELPEGVFLSLIDVAGHGREAAELALQAIRYLKKHASPDLGGILTGLNEHLKGTRGAVAALAWANEADGAITVTGIGNAVIRRCGTREQTYPPPDGILGLRFRTPRINHLTLTAEDLLLIHSDGVTENFPNPSTTPLFTQPVETIARRIVLDQGKLHDDAACIVLRMQS